ncbi:hypothetical protein CDA63_06210 [Hymenobacter amundsenii]|uniref:Uncharacterized protein n=1 Tax=Hymenobacter amundsenii TaxID=2006685 RepID=A0A246FQK0_9BACT|nr:hypothetical protein [Hymenobacter amundsenii]OWP64054.1 hypothetical protein CDA63_06210 [Hymenobacter amundsenii]
MDNAATLAFFQNFYTEASLYVAPAVADALATAPLVVPAVAPLAPAAAAPLPPKPEPVPLPPLPPAVAPIVAPRPTPVAAPVAAAPVPAAPAATPTETTAPAPNRAAVTLTLAQLPAAPTAPPSQPGRVQPTPTQSPVAHIPFSTLGSNVGGLVVLVRLPDEQFRKLPRNVFLNNLLKALRLIVEDVVLVNVEHASYPVALCSLRQQLAARQFLAFGKNLLDVAVYTTQPYEPVLLYGDTAFLGGSEIELLEYDAGRKKKLWQGVQRMFGV